MKNAIRALLLAAAAALLAPLPAGAYPQTAEAHLSAALLRQDTHFWAAANSGDTEKLKTFLAPDVEYYHHTGGIALGLHALVQSLTTNHCAGGPASTLRRQPIPGSLRLHPLRQDGQIYGAILTGEHLLYLTQTGRPEYLDGRVRFQQIWLKKDGAYKITRLLTFDQSPPAPEPKKNEPTLTTNPTQPTQTPPI